MSRMAKSCVAALAAVMLAAGPAVADWTPQLPVEVIVHTGPGGGSDLLARAVATMMEKEKLLPVRMQVINRPGGNGAVAAAAIYERKDDPHTIGFITSVWIAGPLTTSEAKITVQDLKPIAQLVREPAVFAVRADSPFKTLKDFIEAAKAKPGSLKQSGGSVTSRDNIIREQLQHATGAKWAYVSFPGGGARLAALLGGHVDIMVIEPQEAGEQVRAGKLRVLAQLSEKRLPKWADVPTLKEAGFDIQSTPQIRGVVAPPQMPAEAVQYWIGRFEKLRQTASWKKYVADNQLEESLRARARSSARRWWTSRRSCASSTSRPASRRSAEPMTGPGEMTARSLGLDFGTTNTVLSWATPHHPADPVVFRFLSLVLFSFRSALTFWDEGSEDHPLVKNEAGPWAIQKFIEIAGDCRFIQSLKSFAASRLFEQTYVYGRAYRFEDLFAVFFKTLRAHASPQLEHLPRDLLVGRPVAYAGSSRPDAKLAMERYQKALTPFGFERIRQVYEPVAAAFFYAQSLEESATVLVADFGGGTTDFSVIAFELAGGKVSAQALGHSGVGIAGDRCDYRIIDHVVLPPLGKGSTYRSMGKILEMPRSCFQSFASWHELSVMKHSRDFRELKELLPFSQEAELVGRFVRLVESDQGYTLYKAVSEAKEALSTDEAAPFTFRGPGFSIERTIRREEFESWIAEELEAIEAALDVALANSSVQAKDIDRVFLTGGTSFVPAVRRIFERRFGADRVEAGNEFVSIANGLATIGLREDVDEWVVMPPAPRA